MTQLVLKKGGKLYKVEYKNKKYVFKKITLDSIFYLYDDCSFDKDVTLRDIFLLVNKNIKFFHIILLNYCEEIVASGLSKKYIIPKNSEIEYLELKFQISNYSSCYDGLRFPTFTGIGKTLKKDKDFYKKGDKPNYAIEFIPAYELAAYPLKLADEFSIEYIKLAKTKKNNKYEDLKFKNPQYALGQILYAIFWELSWGGTPKQAQSKLKNLKQMVDNIKTGKAKTISFTAI